MRYVALIPVAFACQAEVRPATADAVDTATALASEPAPAERGQIHCASDLDADQLVWTVRADLDDGSVTVGYERPWDSRLPLADAPGEVWEGVAAVEPFDPDAPEAGWELLFPAGDLQLPSEHQLGTGAVFLHGDHVPLTCWHTDLPARVGHEPLPGLPSTLTDGCPAPGNALPLPFVRATGVGRCADLVGQPLNGTDLTYPTLERYDLRGAALDQATLHFAQLTDARLEGTSMAAFDYGYAEVSGRIDDATVLPLDGDCAVEADRVTCRR